MTKSIKFVTVLEGEYARAFHEYMESSVIHETPESRQLTRLARDLSKRIRFF